MAKPRSLIDFCVNDNQREIVKQKGLGASWSEIAKALGYKNKSTPYRVYKNLKEKAALQGWSPDHDMTEACPDTHYLKGTSTLYGVDKETGEKTQKLQWVKTNVNSEQLFEFAVSVAGALAEGVTPAKPMSSITTTKNDEMVVYPMADAHIGLYCWDKDAEEDYSLDLARDTMLTGMEILLSRSPDTERCLIANLGDWFHTDNQDGVTMRSGHRLDVDSRWPKVIEMGTDIMRHTVAKALEKHGEVYLINEIGNHDDHSSIFLSMLMESFYRNEPRLHVDTSPDCFHYHEWGNNLIGVTHGQRMTPQNLYTVMSEDRREACGRCEHRYWYTGHVHHKEVKDIGGMQIERFRTIIPRDKYAHSNGYRSKRDICSIVLHREHGEMQRNTVNVNVIKESLK